MNITISLEEYNELRKKAGLLDPECVFDKEDKCSALTTKMCAGCRFKKTKQELDAGRKKALTRIGTLPNRDYINKKYWSEVRRGQK